MTRPHGRTRAFGAVLVALVVCGPLTAQTASRPVLPVEQLLAEITPADREVVTRVIAQPTIAARSIPEEFTTREDLFDWLLDHPERVSLAWRRLGVKCLPILDRGDGHYSCDDGQGGGFVWRPIWSGPEGRAWYAEGQGKPARAVPTVPIKVVAILRQIRTPVAEGKVKVRQQAEVFVVTDSTAAAVAARLLGPAMPRLAETAAGQLGLFFSGVARTLERHPDHAHRLLTGDAPPFQP